MENTNITLHPPGDGDECECQGWCGPIQDMMLLQPERLARSVYRDLRERKIKNYETL